MLLRNRFLPFTGKAIGFLIIIAVVWYFIAPAYNQLLAAIAEKLVPSQLTLTLQNGTIYIYPTDSTQPVGGIYAFSLHYGLVLVLALIMATPGIKLFRRFRFIGIALCAIFAIHVATIALFAQTVIAQTSASIEHNPLIVLFAIIGSDLFPVVIWAVLSYRFFSPDSGLHPRQKSPD